MMIESPLIQELLEETRAETRAETRIQERQSDILVILAERFGPVPAGAEQSLRSIQDEVRLQALIRDAVRCSDLESFRTKLD